MGTAYQNIGLINAYCFGLIPVLSIVFMYAMIYWTLRKKSREAMENQGNPGNSYSDLSNKKSTLIVTRIVIVLLVSYTPFLIWKEYYYGIGIANPDNVTDTTVIIICFINELWDKGDLEAKFTVSKAFQL